MTEKRYSIELNENGLFLFDNDVKQFMPVTLEQIEILLNVQDRIIKELKDGDVE